MDDSGVSSDEERGMLATGIDVTNLIDRTQYPLHTEEQVTAPKHVTTDRRERLLPWLNQLKWHATLDATPLRTEIDDALANGVVWLRWRAKVDYVEVYEAMELLALLAEIDYREWKSVVQQLWPDAARLWFHLFQGRRFRLGCQVITMRTGVFMSSCERFVLGDVAYASSANYVAMRQELEDAFRDHRRTKQPGWIACARNELRIPVRAKFDNNFGSLNHSFEELWREILQLASMQATRERVLDTDALESYHWRPLFCLVEVNLCDFDYRWSKKNFLYARQIAGCGVRVYPMRLDGVEINQGNATALVSSFCQLLAVRGVATSIDGFSAVRAVSIHEKPSRQTLDGLFSAVVASHSIQEIEVGNLNGSKTSDRERLWQWIAVSVFSNQTAAPIQKLTLHSQTFTASDVSVLETTLRERTALDGLFSWSQLSRRATPLTVTASKFCLLAPSPSDTEMDEISSIQFKSPLTNLRIISEESGMRRECWIRVLLPGWGQAWVARADAALSTAVAPRPVACDPSTKSAKLHIVLEYPVSESEQVYVAFFRTIGHTVRKISLLNCRGDSVLSATALRDVLRACPHLDELEVDSMAVLLNDIATCYEDGSCRATQLVLQNVSIHDASTAFQFFEHLADATRLLAQTLEGLYLRTGLRATLPNFQSAVLHMLQHNRTLETLDLDVEYCDSGSVSPDEFDRQDGVVFRRPLDIRKKAAFLSVVWSTRSRSLESTASKRQRLVQQSAQAAHALDTGVLALVFEFAADAKTRFVRVQV